MTDATAPGAAALDLHTSPAARARLKARYRAEARFRAYGFAAVFVAIAFLALFLTTIFREGIPGFFQHYAVFDIGLSKADIDPNGTGDPNTIGAANYDGLVRDALYALFPGVSQRTERRSLQAILSSGAPISLRRQVLDDPSRIGTTARVLLPLDDVADMYFKGRMTGSETRPGRGELGVSGRTGAVQLSATVTNFEPILAEIKVELRRLAARLESDIAGRERVIARLTSEIDALTRRAAAASGAARTRLEGRIEAETQALAAARAEIEQLRAELADKRRRAAAAESREELDRTMPSYFVRMHDGVIKLTAVSSTLAEGTVLLPLGAETPAADGAWTLVRFETAESNRRIGDREIVYLDSLRDRGLVERRLSREFFFGGASREAELAGVWVAIVGSLMTLSITLALAFPIGVCAAVYLEEFAPKNRITELIEVNINNLAAVPSIIFGLLGLAVFLNVFDMPRSAPVVGGLVLALMTLPIIIIASRAAIRAVPPSIREAALGVGASHQQVVFHHVLPPAMPGILTGTILGMAHALGETAPLLMIGMVAFVVDLPKGITDAATLLPVQIFMWADFPELAFQQKTAAAIIVLLVFLIGMNALAIVLRKRFERRW